MNKLPDASSNLRTAVNDVIDKFITDVDSLATPNVPVDTGKLKNSKEVELGDLNGKIAWTAEYAAFVNDGTRYMAPRPFASDAVAKAQPNLQEALKQVEGKLT